MALIQIDRGIAFPNDNKRISVRVVCTKTRLRLMLGAGKTKTDMNEVLNVPIKEKLGTTEKVNAVTEALLEEIERCIEEVEQSSAAKVARQTAANYDIVLMAGLQKVLKAKIQAEFGRDSKR